MKGITDVHIHHNELMRSAYRSMGVDEGKKIFYRMDIDTFYLEDAAGVFGPVSQDDDGRYRLMFNSEMETLSNSPPSHYAV